MVRAAVQRTTPALLGLFSLATLPAHARMTDPAATTREAVRCRNCRPWSGADSWHPEGFQTSTWIEEFTKFPRAFVEHLTEALCYAA